MVKKSALGIAGFLLIVLAAPTPAQPPAVRSSWASIPFALWHYRAGEFAKAERACRDGLGANDNSARNATVRLILALSCHQNGKPKEAIEHVSRARSLIGDLSNRGFDRGVSRAGLWYDWIFAKILLREAEAAIPADGRAK